MQRKMNTHDTALFKHLMAGLTQHFYDAEEAFASRMWVDALEHAETVIVYAQMIRRNECSFYKKDVLTLWEAHLNKPKTSLKKQIQYIEEKKRLMMSDGGFAVRAYAAIKDMHAEVCTLISQLTGECPPVE